MAVTRAHYDGKHTVPDEPVDLPIGEPSEVFVPCRTKLEGSSGDIGAALAAL